MGTEKIQINYIIGIGFRCITQYFMQRYNLRKFSGPFEYMFLSLEASLKIITNNLDDFMHDIVFLNVQKSRLELVYKKNTSIIANELKDKFKSGGFGYIRHGYAGENLQINQNYMPAVLDRNIYNWDNICMFIHHNIVDDVKHYNTIQKRCDRFKNIVNNYPLNTVLFHITDMIKCINVEKFMNKIIQLKKKINTYFVIIICCNIDNCHYFKEKCLFIFKKINNYEEHIAKFCVDDRLEFDNEYKIISEYFNFNLTELTDIN